MIPTRKKMKNEKRKKKKMIGFDLFFGINRINPSTTVSQSIYITHILTIIQYIKNNNKRKNEFYPNTIFTDDVKDPKDPKGPKTPTSPKTISKKIDSSIQKKTSKESTEIQSTHFYKQRHENVNSYH